MKSIVLSCLSLMLFCTSVGADEAVPVEERIKKLETRVQVLEEFMARFQREEFKVQNRANWQEKARARMRADQDLYELAQLQEIESLYQVANRKWRTAEGKESLEELVAKYRKANRTGCAMLYLGQMSEGLEQDNYYQRAIADFADCFYGDGVRVGTYAKFLYAVKLHRTDQQDEAEKMFADIRQNTPNAIDHRGDLLVDLIDQLTNNSPETDVNSLNEE